MIELSKSKLREQFTCLHLFLRNHLEKLSFRLVFFINCNTVASNADFAYLVYFAIFRAN